MKEAIVTGANGFIGKHLVSELLEAGYYVYAVVHKDNVTAETEFVKYIQCNLDNIETLKNIITSSKSDDRIFFNLAWEGNSGSLRGNYELQIKNIVRTINVAKTAAELGCQKLVLTGSVTQLMFQDYILQDDCKPEATTFYAVGKISCEYFLKCLCSVLNLDMCWTYIANIYGVGDRTANFINFLVNNYSTNQIPKLTQCEQMADFIYVTDVARALIAAGESPYRNRSYYIGYGKPRPLKDFVRIVRDAVNPDIPTGIGLKELKGEAINYSKVKVSKLHDDTGFCAKVPFKDGIKLVLGNTDV